MIKLEIKDDTETKALITENLTCPMGGRISQLPYSRAGTAKLSAIRPKLVGPKPNVFICGESCHHKRCPNKEEKQPKCVNCKGLHVASYKGCPTYKKQAFRHVVDSQNSYTSILRQNSAHSQPQNKTLTFLAEQLVKFIANVTIQAAQPQGCYTNRN